MSGKSDFTEDEWNSLHRGATGAGMLVSLSDAGFKDAFKESSALARSMREAQTSATSQLVRELAATHGTGWKISSSLEEVRAGTLSALKESIVILQSKDPEDIGDYRTFVLKVAEAVAAAAPSGTEAETATIATLREALGA